MVFLPLRRSNRTLKTCWTNDINRLNQSLTPTTTEPDTIVNSKVAAAQINNYINLNLNNLDTSLTKELDRSVLSAVNSAKNKGQSQLGSGKKEKIDTSTKRAESSSQRERTNIKKPFFSPTPKTEKTESSLIHTRHTSNPDPLDSQFVKEKYIFVLDYLLRDKLY